QRGFSGHFDNGAQKGALPAGLNVGECRGCERRLNIHGPRLGNRVTVFPALDFGFPSLEDDPRGSRVRSLRRSVKTDSEVSTADVVERGLARTRRFELKRHRSSSLAAARMRSRSPSSKVFVRPRGLWKGWPQASRG